MPPERVVAPSNVMFLKGQKYSRTSEARTKEILPGGARLPALADDEITSTRKGHGVAVAAGIEVYVAAGLVVLVVVLAGFESGLGRANDKVGRVSLGVGSRSSKNSRDGRSGESQVCKGDHFDEGDVWMEE